MLITNTKINEIQLFTMQTTLQILILKNKIMFFYYN